jgi:hypothetical protein
MVLSHHSQKLYSFEENEPDFETAWRLSAERAKGREVGADCRAPKYLDYQAIGRLGEQVRTLKTLVPENQLHAIVFDDLGVDPGAVYRDTLTFLGTTADGRSAFPVVTRARPTPGRRSRAC